MKIPVGLLVAALCVCAASTSQAQTVTATGPYAAVTDRNAYPEPPLPVLGPAGTTIIDPVFQSSITRVTDGGTRPGHQNYSFRTTSSPHQNEWSAHSSYFYVVSDDGTAIPFRFDPTTGAASRINPTATGNGGLVLSTYVEPQFSYVDDSIIYVAYSGSGTNLHTIDQYDFSTGLYTPLVNLETLASDLSGTYIGGIASSAGPTERVETFFGGTSQDHHHYVLVFDRANPSNRLLLDTWASTINGLPTSVTLNFSLHHVAIDRSGRYAILYTSGADQSGPRKAPQSYVWDTETGSLFAMTVAVHPDGHDALGYGVNVNQDCCTATTWDAAQWQFRSLAAPAVTRDMLPTVLSPKEIYWADHTTWNNASPTALVPYISGTYRYGDNTTPWRALDDEIIAVETNAPGQDPTIWRFAHHRSDVSYDGNPLQESFWYEPRPNVSDDGKWVLFTSNWEKTLGVDPKGDSGAGARQDVFLVKLATVPPVAIATAALPSGRDGSAYSATLQATGGSGTFVWTVTDGALPAGLAIDAASGVLSGTPAAFGTFAVTVSAADVSTPANAATASYTLTIAPPPVVITTTTLPGACATMSYNAALQASGGTGTFAWAIASGVLPAGVTLDPASGAIAGTAQTAGRYAFTATAADSGDPANASAASFSIDVAPRAPEVVLDARSVSAIQGRWQIVPDAMHGTVVAEPDAGDPKLNTALAAPANYFEMTFLADAGRPYHLWIHGLAQNDSYQNDSAWVQFSDSVDGSGTPVYRIGTTDGTFVSLEPCSACGEQGWGWRDNAYGGGLGPDIVFATTGLHTIRIQEREDGFTIGQVVLSSAQYLTLAPGAARNDRTVVPAVAPPPSIDDVVLWASADSHSTNGTWSARADSAAAGSVEMWNPDLGVPKLAAPYASPANYFDVTFNADAGKPYHLWLRMKADNDSYTNDSVWVQFSGSVDASGNAVSRIGTTDGTWVSLEECTGCGDHGWGWQDNAYGAPGDLGPPIYFTQSGPQTIRIQVREDGISVDQIVLSAGKYAGSAPGTAKNDATILRRTQ